MSKKSFIKGATILAVAGLIAKIIGAVFRIPLTNILDTDGVALYQMAYPIYAFLLVASTAGLPVAISKMVSEEIALGNYRGAHKIFQVAFKLLAGIGLITSLILLVGSSTIAKWIGNQDAAYPILAISPSLFFVSVMSAYRGYFQGMHLMYPTALSQIVEQIGKLLLGLTLASLWVTRGAAYGASGAIVGVTLSEIAALVLLLGVYRSKRKEIWERIRKPGTSRYIENQRRIINRIIKIAIPVTLGASIMPLVGFIDVVVVINRLKGILPQIPGIPYFAGMPAADAAKLADDLYGLLTAVANTLVNFPAVLTIALGMSLVPAISESFATKDRKGVSEKTTAGIRITLLIGLPAAVGLAVLAEPIIKMLYSLDGDWKYAHGGAILSTLAVGVVFLTLIQSMTAILQGVGKVTIPVRNLLIGAFFKVVVTYILVGMPQFNVRGAAIGTVVCYGSAALLDFAAVKRFTRFSFSMMDFVIKPAISVGAMGAAVYLLYGQMMTRLGSNSKATLGSIAVGVVVYGVMLLLTGAIKKRDLELIPGGRKLGRVLGRIGILRG